MTIRSPTPPVGENWQAWHAARDQEIREEERERIRADVEALDEALRRGDLVEVSRLLAKLRDA